MSVKRLPRPYCPSAIAFIDSRSRKGLSPHIAISLKLSQPCALRLPYRMAGVLFIHHRNNAWEHFRCNR
ncbi:TPA: hypothetical protein NBQ54_002137 [Klebsiella pneumoniae]|uniref:hypothetical protein n=1 Tax=Klebsiella sp. CN_Kp105 TaxID=3153424 RepID=UPI0006935C6C|nr:hypothetical protein [Klebsiella pneumoniae]MCX2618804.1 hypothetical protein [Klebsiella pneumoniae]TYY43190.1 hypothetical protein FCH00_024075 [Klebsiella pneumoniae]HBQ7655927.1 hypothetical protein [Klebsiella pneumoniae]HBS6581215.1 hypothetical protein [Klebsiella pneumoniae]HBS6690893.1 hypothetical protein [Klebsiella pneumoniae]